MNYEGEDEDDEDEEEEEEEVDEDGVVVIETINSCPYVENPIISERERVESNQRRFLEFVK